MKRNANERERTRMAVCGMIFPLVLVLAGVGAWANEEDRQLSDLAKSVHQRLFADLDAGEQEWIQGLAREIGSGKMNEEGLVHAVTGRSSRKRIKPERAMFHACFMAVPIFNREIAKARREIGRLDRKIGELQERMQREALVLHDQRELLKKSREEREMQMMLLNILINQKSSSTCQLTNIIKRGGSTLEDIIKNLK